MKKVISFITAVVMAIASVVTASAETGFTAPEFTNKSTKSYYVSAGDTFSMDINLQKSGADLQSADLSVTNLGALTLAEGATEFTDFDVNKTYSLKLTVPQGIATTQQVISYKLAYTYKDAAGVPVSKSVSFSSTVNIKVSGATTDYIFAENFDYSADNLLIGIASDFKADIINSGKGDATSLTAAIYDAANTLLVKRYVGTVAADSSTALELAIPAFKTSGKKELTLKLSYTGSDKVSKTFTQSFTLNVSDSTPLTIGTLEAAEKILIGSGTAATFTLINKSTETFTNAQAYLYDSDGKQLSTTFIGAAAAQSQTDGSVIVSGTTEGKQKLTLKITYNNTAGQELSVSKTFTTTLYKGEEPVSGAGMLKIQSVTAPLSAAVDTLSTVSFSITNPTAVTLTGTEAYLLDSAGKQLDSIYISEIGGNSSTSFTLNLVPSEGGSKTYTIKIAYTDKNGNKQTVTSKFKTEVAGDGAVGGAGNGYLKIQSVYPPVSVAEDTIAQISMSLTNPGGTSVKGAEASITDAAGNQIDSIYISELTANTTSSYSFSVPVEGVGEKAYTIAVTYKNGASTQTLSRNISFEALSKTAAETGAAAKPANIKIATINNPSAIYQDVKTDISYSLVNAGKGDASNVEIFVTDSDGNEYAREYVGTIPASSKSELIFKLKINEINLYDLNLNVYYENADETNNTVSRTFQQNVRSYNLSIADISGFDYIMTGQEVNLEFSVTNGGTVPIYNTTAYLVDDTDTIYASSYIGTIEAGIKKERQKFKKVIFNSADVTTFYIKITYENDSLEQFNALSEMINATLMADMSYDTGMDGGYIDSGAVDGGMSDGYMDEAGHYVFTNPDTGETGYYDEMGNFVPVGGDASGLPWWVILIICAGGAIVVVVVIVIIVKCTKKKKAATDEEDNLDYFYAQDGNAKNDTADKK